MIPTERDRLELRHLIDNAELKRRLHLADAVIEAVKAAGPWPRIDSVLIQPSDQTTYPVCRDCHRTMNLPHADDCPGVALRAALDALDAGLED